MGEGEGWGEELNPFPPHLNPLSPGERRYFLRNPNIELLNDQKEFVSWIQPLSATLGIKDLRRGFESETFSRTVIEPGFDVC